MEKERSVADQRRGAGEERGLVSEGDPELGSKFCFVALNKETLLKSVKFMWVLEH